MHCDIGKVEGYGLTVIAKTEVVAVDRLHRAIRESDTPLIACQEYVIHIVLCSIDESIQPLGASERNVVFAGIASGYDGNNLLHVLQFFLYP